MENNYTDDSVCEENMYYGKIIEIPCNRCASFEKEVKQDCKSGELYIIYFCKKQPLDKDKPRWYLAKKDINYWYQSCPLPTEPIRCASCGTVLGHNAPAFHPSSIISFAEASLHSRIMGLEAENAKLKEENQQLRLSGDSKIKCIERSYNEKLTLECKISALQSEISSLKADKAVSDKLANIYYNENLELKQRNNYLETDNKLTNKMCRDKEDEIQKLRTRLPKEGWIAFTDHVKQVTDLNNEIQTLKNNQLSKDEIGLCLAGNDLLSNASITHQAYEDATKLRRKLQSMGDEK